MRKSLLLLAAILSFVPSPGPPPEPLHARPAPEPEVRLPEGGENWDYLGVFELQGQNGPAVAVRLYALDTDSVAEKEMKKGGWGMSIYPNSFSLHAMYRPRTGPWTHTKLYS